MNISIISSSVRTGRNSHRVALYFKTYIEQNAIGKVRILDLNEYQFPIFEERIQYLSNPSPQILQFTEGVKSADAVIIVTPEYNGGYPASLKNVVDLLYTDWKRKPIGIATVSAGAFGGTQVITSLLFTLWKIGASVVPSHFPVPKVQESFDESGAPEDKAGTDKRAKIFLNELIWTAEAKKKMEVTVS
jgi:NAD(P)H-dependent FMN reductase